MSVVRSLAICLLILIGASAYATAFPMIARS